MVRAGGDVTLVAFGATVAVALAAAEQLASEGTEAEVLDLQAHLARGNRDPSSLLV